MSKEEYNTLVEELNRLSENEEKNLTRMKEIAHLLVETLLNHDKPKWKSNV